MIEPESMELTETKFSLNLLPAISKYASAAGLLKKHIFCMHANFDFMCLFPATKLFLRSSNKCGLAVCVLTKSVA